jgi:phosphoglycolate phosphatase-like HAD superfamily hydrolase
LNADAFEMYERVAADLMEKRGFSRESAKRQGTVWRSCVDCFQEWFLGDDVFRETWKREPAQRGKPGLASAEKPLVPLDALKILLEALNAQGKRLGIGTGRPAVEARAPLDAWDVARFFAANAVIHYNHVLDAEAELKAKGIDAALTKPHPFMFLKAALGEGYDDERLFRMDFDRGVCAKTLVVGDAGADLYAAKAAGFDFCAVLTGAHGAAARPFFESEGADYILPDVLRMLEDA